MEYKGIQLHDGKFIETVVCYPRKDKKVLWIERLKSNKKLGEGNYSGPGGELEYGETHDDALIREVYEETTLKIKKYIFMGIVEWLYLANPEKNMRTVAFIVDEWDGEPQMTRDARPEWFDENIIPPKAFSDNKLWVPRILNGEQIYAVITFDRYSDESIILDTKIEPLENIV